ncbi:hypothetical protein IWQ61_010190, partial [Dispira simplex]
MANVVNPLKDYNSTLTVPSSNSSMSEANLNPTDLLSEVQDRIHQAEQSLLEAMASELSVSSIHERNSCK